MLSALAGSVGAGGGASLSMPSSATSSLSDRSPINIAPIGFNLGAILQPMGQGSPENGGVGADFMARYSGQVAGRKSTDPNGINWTMLAIVGAVGVIGLVVMLKI